MLSKSLSTSRKFRALLDKAGKRREFDQILYALIVAHADDFGRLEGDSFTIKNLCYPASPRSQRDFEGALQALNDVGLIAWYEVEQRRYVQIAQFDEHQVGLHKRTRSRFPEPPAVSGKFPEIASELNRTEGNSFTAASPPSARVNGNGSGPPFSEFWALYPSRKGRKNGRGKAEHRWDRLPAADRMAALADVADRKEHDQQWRDDFPPDAHKYLREHAWVNDERSESELPYTPA